MALLITVFLPNNAVKLNKKEGINSQMHHCAVTLLSSMWNLLQPENIAHQT